jgi:transcriptional accessory protein Tex/SPT6
MMKDSLCRIIAGELQARAEQVEAAVRLLDEGNTVPFIARYRKEVTGGLDDTQLRNLAKPRNLSMPIKAWPTRKPPSMAHATF